MWFTYFNWMPLFLDTLFTFPLQNNFKMEVHMYFITLTPSHEDQMIIT